MALANGWLLDYSGNYRAVVFGRETCFLRAGVLAVDGESREMATVSWGKPTEMCGLERAGTKEMAPLVQKKRRRETTW